MSPQVRVDREIDEATDVLVAAFDNRDNPHYLTLPPAE
jgi:hypothetical protein